MTLSEKKAALLAELSALEDPQDRLAWVIRQGYRKRLPETLCVDAHRVEGCLSNLWLVCRAEEGRCYFETDSDSAIVRGIASVLAELYSGHTPREILEVDPAFLAEVGIQQHLSANRRNALARLWTLIRDFAVRQEGSRGAGTTAPPPP